MKHLGDITKISGYDVLPVDVLIGGSPCQDLSIAGKRAGLAGARSGLFLEQIRIIKEMRDADVRRGRTGQFIRPRFMVWENVPGSFSSNKGDDFRAVLEETIRIADPDSPDVPLLAKGKWPLADCWMGDGWSIAYRVLDAQFWGVPQRRRRIALVADFGGHAAPEILFVRESVCGDTAKGGAPGEEAAAGTGSSTPETIWCLQGNAVDRDAKMNGIGISEEPMFTLNTIDRHAVAIQINTMLATRHNKLGRGTGFGIGSQDGPQFTISAAHSQAVFQSGVICIQGAVVGRSEKAGPMGKGWRDDDISYTVDTKAPSIICAGFKHKAGAAAGSIGYQKETAPTLSAEQTSAVYVHQNQLGEVRTGTVAGTLNTNSNASGRNAPLLFENHGQDSRVTGPLNIAPTVSQKFGTGGNNTPLVMATGQAGAEVTRDMVPTLNCNHEQPIIAHTLRWSGRDPQMEDAATYPVTGGKVRRLTPVECERLQGYPDGWTDIGAWKDSAGKLHKESSDSARYKALGNSIALPPWSWVLKRICACYERTATMASLFDGIGGFPLIWERLNGPGSCLWASEIEEFPIAVTKRRFNFT